MKLLRYMRRDYLTYGVGVLLLGAIITLASFGM